jgi:hypothetical protein
MRKKPRTETSFILFDVVYQDGTRTSYRKIPAAQLDELDGIKAAKAFIEQQDRKVAELSGVQRGPIKQVLRSARQ